MQHKRQTETSRAVFAAAPDRLGNRTIARRTEDAKVVQLVPPAAARTVRRSPDAATAAYAQEVRHAA